MTPSSTPITAPTAKISIVRQGRHAVGDPADPEPSVDIAIARLLSRTADGAALSERPLVVKQRIALDQGHLRRLRRSLPDLAGLEQRFEIEATMRTLAENIQAGNQTLDRLVESGRTRRWGPSDFEPGDQVRYLSSWYEVLGVGPVGLTVRAGSSENAPAEYTRITGRRRDGVEDVDAA